MQKKLLSEADSYLARRRRRQIWLKVVGGLACVVVFCTTYALILPAITMENMACEIEEHIHTEECYSRPVPTEARELVCSPETLGIHVHQFDCFDAEGNVLCGYADFVVHSHDSSCYDANGSLVCPLPEVKEHIHSESCYALPLEEGHTHTEACYMTERGELLCPLEEGHTHVETCYTLSTDPVCQKEEGHSHDESCFAADGTLLCGIPEREDHIHSDSCYGMILACQIPETGTHQHTDECYAQKKTLICGLEETGAGGEQGDPQEPELICTEPAVELHIHKPECYAADGTLLCGKLEVREHVHSADCFQLSAVSSDGETAAGELVCGMVEHTHGPACYADLTADLETAERWESTFADTGLTGEWSADVLSIAQTQLGYGESRRNYIVLEDGTTTKGYSRYGAWYGDPYGDWSGMFVAFCLQYAGVEEMPIEADCAKWIAALSRADCGLYQEAAEHDPAPGELIFFDLDGDGRSDRVGLVAELTPAVGEESGQIETIEGDASDRVQRMRYVGDDPAILGFGMLPEQVFYCGRPGHVHGDGCFDSRGQVICGKEEYIHTEDCQIPQEQGTEESQWTELTCHGPDYTIRVQYGADAALPEGVSLTAEEIPQGSAAYQSYLDQTVEAMDAEGASATLVFARFFDIRFQLDGQVLEPAAPVTVTIEYDTPVDTSEMGSCQAIHFGENGTELLQVQTEEESEGASSFTHIQNGFSVVGNLVTVDYSAENSADVGPNVLPVDYYVCIDGEWTCVGSTKTGWYGDETAADWTDTNRDYITVRQAESILGEYGFSDGQDLNKKVAYQQKSGNTSIYADVNTPASLDGKSIVPLSRNGAHPGYNLYYLPGNTELISNVGLDSLDKGVNGFYTVKVYDAQGALLASDVVLTGGSFTYDADGSSVTGWLVAYGDGRTETVNGSSITLNSITSPVTVSPQPEGAVGSHSVTFKVMVDGQWETVGSLPYYYSGSVDGSQRAYITSGMAAQFFGDYGYTATEAPGYHFGYSYDDIYEIYYDQSNFCMDIPGGNIAENTSIQLYEANHSDAQTFRIWEAGEGYHYITPVTNSGLHVNILVGGSANDAQIALHSATDDSSRWKVQEERNSTVSFWSKNAPDSACIDLDSGKLANGTKIHLWNHTENRYWKLSQVYRISNQTVSQQNSDGTWNIGLTEESNGDIVCYYLPGETAASIANAAESSISASNSFWSVTVRDDVHAVYSEGELSNMVQYVRNGGEATVTVRNAEGVLWSCAGKNGEAVEVTETQADGNTTFTITNITQPVEVVATRANPSFTVQYYAVIPRMASSGGSASLAVIDTTAEKNGGSPQLPQNGGDLQLRYLQLEGTGQNTSQNRGNQTELYQVKTDTTLTRMYTEEIYQFEASPGLEYFNKLKDNENYQLARVGVLKEGKDPESTNDGDWDWYKVADGVSFTNVAAEADQTTILITEGAVLRLWFNTTTSPYYNGTTFYDYNISSGQNDDGRWRTGITGINSESNYGTSLNGQRNWKSYADVFAFGNANCGTGMSGYLFDGGTLNKYNSANKNYGGATFGLVQGLNSDGTIRYNERLVVPNLFNDGDASGKQTYSGSSLTFDRVGDTYTLSAATLNNSNGQQNTISNLQYFFNPSPTSGTTYTHIFTNNFWPMDQAAGKTDALWGAYGSTGSFQGFQESNTGAWGDLASNFPPGDDGNAHNWFFGMNFAISFNLTEDYVGPLEYTFFGDDDLWVFLDNRLICDIGGVHSSIGEYVNLRDYLPEGSSGQHTLSFFYTERGASGSTCYMQFTLPSVSSATTSRDTGSLQISKALENTRETADYSGVEYQFQVELLTGESGSPLNQTFSYSRSGGTYGTIKSGGVITLHQNESATISGIPAGTYYRVTELTTQGYQTTVNGAEGYIASGTIENGGTKPAAFVNTPFHELPQTGGPGILWYTFGGAAAIAAAALMYITQRRRKGDG